MLSVAAGAEVSAVEAESGVAASCGVPEQPLSARLADIIQAINTAVILVRSLFIKCISFSIAFPIFPKTRARSLPRQISLFGL